MDPTKVTGIIEALHRGEKAAMTRGMFHLARQFEQAARELANETSEPPAFRGLRTVK